MEWDAGRCLSGSRSTASHGPRW